MTLGTILVRHVVQMFAASTPISTRKYSANLRIIWRLKFFFPDNTSEIEDFGKAMSLLNCVWDTPLASIR